MWFSFLKGLEYNWVWTLDDKLLLWAIHCLQEDVQIVYRCSQVLQHQKVVIVFGIAFNLIVILYNAEHKLKSWHLVTLEESDAVALGFVERMFFPKVPNPLTVVVAQQCTFSKALRSPNCFAQRSALGVESEIERSNSQSAGVNRACPTVCSFRVCLLVDL